MIFFNIKKVRDFLMNNEYVYTIRDHILKKNDIAVTGNRRNLKKLCDVKIEFVGFVASPDDLTSYTHMSGFINSLDWYYLAREMCKGTMILYKVIKC